MKTLSVAMVSLALVLPIAYQRATVSGSRKASEACRALADLRIEDTNLLSAAAVPAGHDLPEYCRVLGYVRPAINFEIRLPTSSWNGKFYMAGCGGFCGKLESDNTRINAINIGLKRNYAVSTTDGGHWGETLSDGRWAYHNRQAEIDWGYRAVHETARVTKAVIEAFYEQVPERSYFQGCSTGGRQAVMEAWRYPDDFDGIISGAGDIDASTWYVFTTWLARANTGLDGSYLISAAEAKLIGKAVVDACDRVDGLEDGLIDDPRACRFDPAILACEGDQAANCLSENQVDALKKIYDGPRDTAGRQLYEGLPFGSEPFWPYG